ncbi:hypothetical protein COS81_04345 [candidate division WWE3 bacterium CG06_land_8_20_14_3_00_42_16]|uniref:Nudix hydrolase domain-containing protein n=3 Tax=Katanobacteria TaxID=422282 RepID=A0A2M7ALR2_UNCKA|nr:MAG: hypothetical protein AUJ38_04045 [bacterium CG1_02_42_9]PIU68336.1 MAG: hypothetical protein COS81_04345 [candidate division WWE3 bacterium CG06_land_8_20_14_3_00_42_16]PIZ41987.1 MAG: hypothetical protein COY34_03665 [candidate division WWE3 bacterium CG_4_10_14_0_2_um_filter_42_8]PJC69456.1 MAG: hypothetical protein CO015_00170 [candidate division WWE3 bacterium CG_4_8_14_3_um_filter_42_11]
MPEAHTKGLLHRTVIAELINPFGGWTLTKQTSDRQDPYKLVSPIGGHVLAGESEIEALKRESEKETGITDFKFKLVGRKVFNRFVRNRQENHLFIVFEIYSSKKPVVSKESIDFKRFTKEMLIRSLRQKPEIFGEAFFFVIRNFYPKMLVSG